MNHNKHQLQQGDVILRRVKSLPDGAKQKPSDSRGIVLAEGETTGHFHGIAAGVAELYEADGKVYLNVKKRSASLTHQEHNPVTITPGIWEVGGVREYDYLNDMERKVVD